MSFLMSVLAVNVYTHPARAGVTELECPAGRVCLHHNQDFDDSGYAIVGGRGYYSFKDSFIDNAISSVRNNRKGRVRLFDRNRARGASVCVDGRSEIRDLAEVGFDNLTTSMKMQRERKC